jgi:predicted metalloenzyme YecM
VAGGPVEGTKLTIDGADIRVVDVSIDEIGHLAFRVHGHTTLVGRLHQGVQRCIVIQDNSLLLGQPVLLTRLS